MSRRAFRSSRWSRFVYVLPALAVAVLVVAFRPQPVPQILITDITDPLQLPPGWPMPPVPSNNPITKEKFLLGRQLFYEVAISGDSKTSCATCHNPRLAFAARGAHAGAFGDSGKPARMVPRLMNVAYDSVLTWDGHLHSLEEQVHVAVLKKGDLKSDTTVAFKRLANNPAYAKMFKDAFGDASITLDRIAMAIATFERCFISANSPYDQYLRGDKAAMSSDAVAGMNLFFDTTKTNCAFCHNSSGTTNANSDGQLFTDNAYYRTGTFESDPKNPNGGYGIDTTSVDTNRDGGRALVTKDTKDIGKFRTPSLRNVGLSAPFGADGFVSEMSHLLQNYNRGGDSMTFASSDGGRTFKLVPITNKAPRITPLNLDAAKINQLSAFINSLTDLDFISNPLFQDPGPLTMKVDGHYVSDGISLYPNPSSGTVTVQCPDVAGTVDAVLLNTQGSVVWHRSLRVDGNAQLDLAGVPNGAYRLELRAGSMHHASKIVLER
jgi:cytochrome c peroxidase